MSDETIDWVSELVGDNLLAVLDVLLDIEKEIQLGSNLTIPLLQLVVRFPALFPADSIALRDRYCETRWKATQLLKQKGIFSSVEHIRGVHRWKVACECRSKGRRSTRR